MKEMTDEEKVLYVMFNLCIKVSMEGKITDTIGQLNELQMILKEEYGIKLEEVLCENQNITSIPFCKPPALINCSVPPDGKARRRERRKQERIKRN